MKAVQATLAAADVLAKIRPHLLKQGKRDGSTDTEYHDADAHAADAGIRGNETPGDDNGSSLGNDTSNGE